MKKFKLFFSIALVALLMLGNLFVQAQVGPPERICDDNGEKRVMATADDDGNLHCWQFGWDHFCYVPCGAEPDSIAP